MKFKSQFIILAIIALIVFLRFQANEKTVSTPANLDIKIPSLKLPHDMRRAIPYVSKFKQPQELKVAVVKLKEVETARPLVSSGVPFAPGQLKSEQDFAFYDLNGNEIPIATKVLVRWPDQSIRSVLVQFPYTIDHKYSYLNFKWGVQRQLPSLNIVPLKEDYPQAMVLLPAFWLCQSQVIGEQIPLGRHGFPKYEENLDQYFGKHSQAGWTGDVSKDNFYDTPHVFYQFFVRTGDVKFFEAARRELLHYRDTQVIHEGENKGDSINNKFMYVYVEAMLDDYLLTGDERSLAVAKEMAERLRAVFPVEKAFYPKGGEHFWTERNAAFAFLGILKYYELTLDSEYLKIADQIMENLYKTQLQWPERGGFIHNLHAHDPEEGAELGEFGGSPFMTGFLLEAIVRYHQLTQSEIAADSIFRAVDWLIKEGLVASGDSFKYTTAKAHLDSGGEPDLNLTLVHAFGYAYRLSGYQESKYLAIGAKVFERGITQGFLGSRKHFNQNYRSSGHFLAYIQDGLKQEMKVTRETKLDSQKSQKDILYEEDFEFSFGRFKGSPDAKINLDKENVYNSATALKIQSQFDSGNLNAGFEEESWNIDDFPKIKFVYRIPPQTPVGLRVKTSFGDWLCIGGTAQTRCGQEQTLQSVTLEDDNQWHEITLDVAGLVRSRLPQLDRLSHFEFYTEGNALKNHQFWIDDFKICQ